ncbi:MAG: hypothetical protein M3P98_00710 [bacterium]|nr:hypothetical protein [bacterium]
MPENRIVIGVIVLASLGAVYGLVSLAFDSGSYWHYLGALIALVVTFKFVQLFIKVGKSGKKQR